MNGDDIDFSYDGNDEETKRLASEPKKLKPAKVIPVKKKEQRPIALPNKPIEVAVDPTPVNLDEQLTPITQKEIPTIEKTTVQTTKDVQKISDIDAPTVVVATVVAAASFVALSNVFKAKTKLKSKGKTKPDSKKPDNRNKEEKKEEEQKQCTSRSDKVQQLINEVKLITDNNFIEEVKIKEDKVLKDRMKALNLEMILLNKKIKSLEDNTHKKKSK